MFKKPKTLFSKKSKPIKIAKQTESEIKWNKLWELYGEGKFDNFIFYLCDYYSGISGEGHFCFFDNKENELKTYDEELRKVLPEDLYDNFDKAYQIWLRGDDEQTENACSIADNYFNQNENRIIEILQQNANMPER